MCTSTVIDEVTRRRIAAYGATFRKATKSPFGDADEIGMLNLITAESRRAIMGRADVGTMFDLSVDHFTGMPGWFKAGDPPYQIWMTHTPRGEEADDVMGVGRQANELVSYSGDAVSMYTHCGTHIDTLNHFGYRGEIFNGFKADEHLGSRAWRVCGAEKQPPIVARGVLLDVAGLHGLAMLPPSHGIGAKEIQDCLKHQGIELRPGDVVMVRTGRMSVWPDHDAFSTNAPGINREGAEFLAKAGAITIGGDTLSLEQIPSADPENWMVVHTYLLAEAGIPIMEVVDLEAIAAAKLHEFAFFGACIRLRGATGAPMRPVAMPLGK